MKVIYYRLDYKNKVPHDIAACIGFFDGIHKGHQELILKTKEIAKSKGLKSAMITFDPSPKSLVTNTKEELLTPVHEKIKLLESYGLDYMIIITFNKDLQFLEYDQFIEKVFIGNQVQHLICGEDFRFGFRGKGSISDIKEVVPLTVVQELKSGEEPISSTLIKEYIKAGEMEKANSLLGNNYELSGYVVHGKKRGRLIGFPTANMRIRDNKVIPDTGVYTAITIIDEKPYISTINVGYNPTFSKLDHVSIESFIHDFKDVVYGKETRFVFLKKLRDEISFDGVEALIDQMNKDVMDSEEYFTEEKRLEYGIGII